MQCALTSYPPPKETYPIVIIDSNNNAMAFHRNEILAKRFLAKIKEISPTTNWTYEQR